MWIENRDVPTSTIDRLTVCKHCDAKFDPTVRWAYGWRPKNDTSGAFYSCGKIPLGNCPVCRKDPRDDD